MMCKKLNHILLDRLKIRLYMGIGEECNQIQEYNKSFKMARKLLKLINKGNGYTMGVYSFSYIFIENLEL